MYRTISEANPGSSGMMGETYWDNYQDWLNQGNTPNPPVNWNNQNTFSSPQGLVLSSDNAFSAGSDFARENSGSSTWNDAVVFLKDANSNGFNLPADETLLVAQREQQWNAENNPDGFNYTVLSRSNTGEVIERSFDKEGLFSEQRTLNELQIAAAELKTWIDLNGDNNIGGSVQSIEFTNNSANQWNNLNLYKTEAGLVTGQGNFTLNIGDDLSTVAWGQGGGAAMPGMEGSGKLLMANGSPFQLNTGDSIITAKRGYLQQPVNGANHETFELFLSSDNGSISHLVFGSDGELIQLKPNSTTADQGLISGALSAIDVDGDTDLIFNLTSNSIEGFALTNDGSWTFDPHNTSYESLKKGQEQSFVLSYSVTDPDGASGSNSFTITIKGTNDLPIATFSENQQATEKS